MNMKYLGRVLISFSLGAFLGVLYYSLSWRYHLPYVGLNWLGPLIGADGEKGYDAMLYESMIDFGMLFAFAFLLIKSLSSRKSHRP